jgi:signal transduction histidine kinase
MEPRGVLEVVTYGFENNTGEPGVVVEVLDTGHGIAAEHLSRIYDPFFTTKSAKKGTGLGLSVTYGIIQEHGAMIEALSRPGGGTCFRLQFPAVRKAVHV